MRQFERDDVLRAAAGDVDALLRVQRRKDVLKWNALKRRIALQNATPSWADHEAIDAYYTEAKRLSVMTGSKHDVDHIIPLQGKHVCRLHVPWNLRVITKTDNVRKHANCGDEDVIGFLADRGFKVLLGVNKLKRAIKLGKRETVLFVSPKGQIVLSVEYVQGEFVIDSAPEGAVPPSVVMTAVS